MAALLLLGLLAHTAQSRAQQGPITPQRPTEATNTGDQPRTSAASAAVAAPKPLAPSPDDPHRPAYQLYLEYDLPILGIGLVFAASRLVLEQPPYCAPRCDPSNLNALDRRTAGSWRPAWQHVSNAGIAALAGGAALVLLLDEGFLNAVNDGVVIAEAALAAMATTSIMTLAAGRPRPFVYGEQAPLSERNSSDASFSFLSSHAATAFATATALFMTSRRLHPLGRLPFVIAGVGAALASLVAVARVLGGMHFVTDAIGGAVVGTAMGVLVPALHRSPLRVAASSSQHRQFISLTASF